MSQDAGAGRKHDDADQLAIATIRTLAMDAVQQARPGHPGTPVAMAPVAYALFLAAALFERFSARGEADFQDRLPSAMRFQFGGHVEKRA
jgi:6-phosphogluconate dehydrogenase (decarboxylating)